MDPPELHQRRAPAVVPRGRSVVGAVSVRSHRLYRRSSDEAHGPARRPRGGCRRPRRRCAGGCVALDRAASTPERRRPERRLRCRATTDISDRARESAAAARQDAVRCPRPGGDRSYRSEPGAGRPGLDGVDAAEVGRGARMASDRDAARYPHVGEAERVRRYPPPLARGRSSGRGGAYADPGVVSRQASGSGKARTSRGRAASPRNALAFLHCLVSSRREARSCAGAPTLDRHHPLVCRSSPRLELRLRSHRTAP